MGGQESKLAFKSKIAELSAQSDPKLELLNELLNFPSTQEDFFHFIPKDLIPGLLDPWILEHLVNTLGDETGSNQQV
jgi:esterase/lipase superfamily enzyme